MAFSKLLLFATLAVAAVASPSGIAPHVVHGARDSVPHGWSLHRRADPDTILPLKFTLAQSNLHNLNAYLLDVADPFSPNYGKHWSPHKVADTFRPSAESVETVHSWLTHDLGVEASKIQLNRNRDTVVLNVTVAEAEEILGAEYYIYVDNDDGVERVGCHGGYSLPEHVSKHVDFVWPTVHFRKPLKRRTGSNVAKRAVPTAQVQSTELEATGCDQAVTIECLQDLYNFNYTFVSGDKNSVAVVEVDQLTYAQSDLDLYFSTYEPSLVGHSPTLISVDGGTLINASMGIVGETTLDITLIMGLVGPDQELGLYQLGGDGSEQLFNDELLGALDGTYCAVDGVSSQGLEDCGDVPLSNVISISYHWEPDYLDSTISPILQRECAEYGKLSLTGLTFIVSSGDGGVAYSAEQGCLINGTIQYFSEEGAFIGEFPGTCPYVTSVGATSVAPGNSVEDPEIATTVFGSGGGFSSNFALQSWQEDAVNNYLTNYGPSYGSDIFNRSGRAHPDVAANGYPIVLVEYGGFVTTGGTSASAPIFAAVVTAINDARIAAGKSPVGFINPTLYSSLLADAFNDVTEGNNPGCGTDGFSAAPGWDPVTGLGTPNVAKMIEAFLTLP